MPEEMLDRIREVRESLKHSEKGKLFQTKENCVTVLENDPLLKGAIRMNLFTETMAIVKDLGWKRTSPPINDDDMCQLYLYMEMFYGLTVEKNIQNAVRVVANRNEFHPVREYLERLHWDGRERIRYALKRYLGAADDDLTYTVFKTFMMGAISRVYNPGIKFEMMLCLVGSQGVGKSSFFRLLAIKDDWFCDDIKKLNDDEIYLKLQGHWFIEMAEMLGTSSAKSVEEIKAFISRQKEIYRIRFDKYSKDRYRQCVFTGTTNRQRFLPPGWTGPATGASTLSRQTRKRPKSISSMTKQLRGRTWTSSGPRPWRYSGAAIIPLLSRRNMSVRWIYGDSSSWSRIRPPVPSRTGWTGRGVPTSARR